jgi:hypothetical protein
MSTEELLRRLRRLHVALEGIREPELGKFVPTVTVDDGVLTVAQDFSGGASEAEIEHAAHGLVHSIASLRDPLRRWAKKQSKATDRIDGAFRTGDLAVLVALDNHEKHGGPPRPGSGELDRRLANLDRGLQLTTGAKAGSYVVVEFTPRGPRPSGEGGGGVEVVIDGDVLDGTGQVVGQLHGIALAAVDTIEALLHDLGLELG